LLDGINFLKDERRGFGRGRRTGNWFASKKLVKEVFVLLLRPDKSLIDCPRRERETANVPARVVRSCHERSLLVSTP
jgi:hypothetical protein